MKMDEWVDIDELSKKLKVKKSWVYGQTMRRDKGAMPRIKLGKHLRFDPEAVEAWIMKRNAA